MAYALVRLLGTFTVVAPAKTVSIGRRDWPEQIDGPKCTLARDTAIRHREVRRHHVVVLARGARINYLVI
jgi:hypothetical protein